MTVGITLFRLFQRLFSNEHSCSNSPHSNKLQLKLDNLALMNMVFNPGHVLKLLILKGDCQIDAITWSFCKVLIKKQYRYICWENILEKPIKQTIFIFVRYDMTFGCHSEQLFGNLLDYWVYTCSEWLCHYRIYKLRLINKSAQIYLQTWYTIVSS